MINKELVTLINKTPKKLRACISGSDAYVNIEKLDFKLMLLESPDSEYFEVEVRANGIYVESAIY
jgi:hypothetical protein